MISRFHHLGDWQVSNKASHSFPQGKIIGRRRPLSWSPAIWRQVSLHSISQQLHPDPWPWHWPLMALSEVHSDLLRWPALLVSIREGSCQGSPVTLAPNRMLKTPSTETNQSWTQDAKVKVHKHIHQLPVTEGQRKSYGSFQHTDGRCLQTVLWLNGKDISKYGLQNTK